MEPASERLSTAREATATYAAGLGYDILRLHGTKAVGEIDGAEVRGTAYFQKVKVQAPSVPWYWGSCTSLTARTSTGSSTRFPNPELA